MGWPWYLDAPDPATRCEAPRAHGGRCVSPGSARVDQQGGILGRLCMLHFRQLYPHMAPASTRVDMQKSRATDEQMYRLRHTDGMTYRQIAESFGCSVSRVSQRLRREERRRRHPRYGVSALDGVCNWVGEGVPVVGKGG